MRGSSILSWKQLASTIHPPLPINRRDSHRLLGLLKTSFDQALEREHPKVSPTGRNTTEEHLRAVLSSPHFSAGPSSSSPLSIASPPRAKQSLVDKIVRSSHAFKEQVAAGSMSLDRAKQHVNLHYRVLSRGRELGEAAKLEVLKTVGLGSTVANWLWSAGLIQSSHVLADAVLLERLISLLVLENQSVTVTQWLARLGSSGQQPTTILPLGYERKDFMKSYEDLMSYFTEISESRYIRSSQKTLEFRKALECTYPLEPYLKVRKSRAAQKLIMLQLVTSVDLYGHGLGDAMRIYVSFLKTLKGLNEKCFTLRPAAGFIVKRLLQSTKTSHLDPRIYDTFLESVHLWGLTAGLHGAILALRHPTRPCTEAVHTWFRNTRNLEKIKELNTRDPSLAQESLLLGLTAADTLLSSGKSGDLLKAKEIMATLKRHFAVELGDLETSAGPATGENHCIAGYLKLLKHKFGRSPLLAQPRHATDFAVS